MCAHECLCVLGVAKSIMSVSVSSVFFGCTLGGRRAHVGVLLQLNSYRCVARHTYGCALPTVHVDGY